MRLVEKKKVVIVGGGFAGVETAIHLDKNYFDVHLFSERNFLFMYPLAFWIPIGKKHIRNVSIPLDILSEKHHFTFHKQKVTSLNLNAQKIYCSGLSVDYHYLVLAGGSAHYHLHGSEDIAGICSSPQETNMLKQKYSKLLQAKKGHIAVGFGHHHDGLSVLQGISATEIIFNLDHDLRKKRLRENFKLSFFTSTQLDESFWSNRIKSALLKNLKKRNIDLYTNLRINSFNDQWIEFEDGGRIESDFTIYMDNYEGHEIYKTAQIPVSKTGFVKVSSHGQVTGEDVVFAAGDVVDFQGPQWMSKQVHLSLRQARQVAKNIEAHALQKPLQNFPLHAMRVFVLVDMGSRTAFIYKTAKHEFYFSLPLGYIFKWSWGFYYRIKKLGLFLAIFDF